MRAKRSSNKVVEVPAGQLAIHPTAQRVMNPTKLRGLIADLDLDALNFVHVVKRDNSYFVVDGQHRVTALVRLGLGDWPVRCEVHTVANDGEASDLFLKLNNRAAVGSFDTFQNEVHAGEPAAVRAKAIIKSRGLKVDRQGRDGHVTCVVTIKKLTQIDDGQTLGDVIDASLAAWGTRATAVEGRLLEGLALVYGRFNGELDRPRLVKKLAKYPGGPAGLIGDARGISRLRGTSLVKAIAEVVLITYNHGTRESNRLEMPR